MQQQQRVTAGQLAPHLQQHPLPVQHLLVLVLMVLSKTRQGPVKLPLLLLLPLL